MSNIKKQNYSQSVIIRNFNFDHIRNNENFFLNKKEIHIWAIKWKDALPLVILKWNIMSEKEREKAEKFLVFEDKMRCATGKIMARIILSRYTKLKESMINIVSQKYGKPYLKSDITDGNIHYNTSHSGDFVLLAFTKLRLIGIDVEKIIDIPEYIEISKQFFSYEEYKNIKKIRKHKLFYQYWTAKEAYVKALGKGLSKELNIFEISGNFIFEKNKRLVNWRVIPINFKENYSANIAVKIE